jgi:hypothetical protein
MQITAIILGCLLLAQSGKPAEPNLSQEPDGAAKLQPITAAEGTAKGESAAAPTTSAAGKAPRYRLNPPEMVAEALMLPAGSALTGQPLTLLRVLSSTPDRRRQLQLTKTYWRLAQAVANYHFCRNRADELAKLSPRAEEAAAARLARASSAASLREAELDVADAQHELAGLMPLPPDAPLPLPADRPHVGPYRTHFQELFATRTPPDQARLVERVLPVWRQVVDERAAAVQAAEDALTAAMDNHAARAADASTVAACSEELLRQQRAFIRAVCDYNRHIAEYGVAVAGPTTTPQALVAMLIGPVPEAATPLAPGVESGVQPAGLNETATIPGARNEPTLAPPRDAKPLGVKNEPTLAPPRDGWKRNEPTLAPPRDSLNLNGKNEPTLAPPRESVMPDGPNTAPSTPPRPLGKGPSNSPLPLGEGQGVRAAGRVGDDASPLSPHPNPLPKGDGTKQPLVPVNPKSPVSDPIPVIANKLTVDAPAAPIARQDKTDQTPAAPLYPALADAEPAVRAKQLTVTLHWDRSLPEGAGKPINLLQCLASSPPGAQRAAIGAYWLVRQRAAQYQVLAQQAEWIEALTPVVLERRSQPAGAAEMLRVRSAQLSAEAAVREAHAALIEAQFDLTLRVGGAADSVWPLASTPPHSGRYLLKLEAQPKSVAESWPMRRLAAMIPALGDSVQQRAAVVVESDAARAAATEKYRVGGASLDSVLESVGQQTEQTLAFLETLTDYNRAIADYALAVLPPAAPAEKLASALVVKP